MNTAELADHLVEADSKLTKAQAKQLLERYLQASLTPDDPPREQAQKLLQQVKGS